MYFKGTIVITDPCYIIKENPIKCPNEKDFGLPASIDSKPFKDYSTPSLQSCSRLLLQWVS